MNTPSLLSHPKLHYFVREHRPCLDPARQCSIITNPIPTQIFLSTRISTRHFIPKQCFIRRTLAQSWKYNHRTMILEESRIIWCEEASERGSVYTLIVRTSKASGRNRLLDCPDCRNTPLKGNKDDEGTGGGSTDSSAAIIGTTVNVGA